MYHVAQRCTFVWRAAGSELQDALEQKLEACPAGACRQLLLAEICHCEVLQVNDDTMKHGAKSSRAF